MRDRWRRSAIRQLFQGFRSPSIRIFFAQFTDLVFDGFRRLLESRRHLLVLKLER
jgi:hypothetical protein